MFSRAATCDDRYASRNVRTDGRGVSVVTVEFGSSGSLRSRPSLVLHNSSTSRSGDGVACSNACSTD